jgi:Sec-independent protein translocase protein TatA
MVASTDTVPATARASADRVYAKVDATNLLVIATLAILLLAEEKESYAIKDFGSLMSDEEFRMTDEEALRSIKERKSAEIAVTAAKAQASIANSEFVLTMTPIQNLYLQ